MNHRIRFSSAAASLCIAMLAVGVIHGANAASTRLPDMEQLFTDADVQGTFVLLDAQTGRTVRHNPARAQTRYIPASTYKIPNSLIALETGVASGADFTLAWNNTWVFRSIVPTDSGLSCPAIPVHRAHPFRSIVPSLMA